MILFLIKSSACTNCLLFLCVEALLQVILIHQQKVCLPMANVNILKYGVSSPADVSPMQQLKSAGYESKDILAVIGKSEGQ